jgi:hypothetical protein
VKYTDIPRLLTMSIVWLLLLVWYLNAYRLGCTVALALVAVLALILAISGEEMRLVRRRVFLHECLEPTGQLYRIFSRRYLLLGLEAVKSAALAVFLLASVLSFAPRQWSLLFADVLLLGLLLPRFYGALEGQVREEYRFAMARRWSMWVSVVLLWLESLTVLFFSTSENYMGLRYQEVVGYAVSAPEVQCGALAHLGALGSAIQALGQWSAQNLMRSFNDLPQSLMASLGLLAAVLFSFLIAYAYSRALIGAVGRPWAAWRVSPRRDPGHGLPAGSLALDRDRRMLAGPAESDRGP